MVIALALIGALVVLVIVIAIIASSDDDGDDTATGSGDGTKQQSGSDGDGDDTEGEADEVDDAEVSECTVDELGWMEATIAVTNDSSERSNYYIEVAFETPDGSEQLTATPVFVNGLEPGQSTTAEAISATDAPGGEGSFSCRIIELDRMSDETG